MEALVEPVHTSFKRLIDCYFDLSYLFVNLLLTGSAPLHEHNRMMTQRANPSHLQAEYSLLQLQAGASLTEMRTQYRELAKRYHPDGGGCHADFIALQQAYERVVEHLQAHE